MFSRHGFALLVASVLVLAPVEGRAQYDHWELNLHAGALRVDLFEQPFWSPLVGAKIMRHWDNGWGFGPFFDYAWEDDAVVYHNIPMTDLDMYFYGGELNYTLGRGPFHPFLSLGVGAATVELGPEVLVDLSGNPRDGDRGFLQESQTKFLLEPGVGFKILNSRTDPWIAFRVDLEDKIVFDFPQRERTWPANEVPVEQHKTNFGRETNNWALTAGLSFLFGGVPGFAPPPVSCPICPTTYVEPEPALICVEDQWWYTSDASITVNGRQWIKFGAASAIPRDELIRIGEVDGVPVYIRHDAQVPYQEVLLPLCSPEGFYQPYVPEQEVRGTTG